MTICSERIRFDSHVDRKGIALIDPAPGRRDFDLFTGDIRTTLLPRRWS